jgi:MFS family permease
MKTKLERNIKLFYILRALTLPYFWLPILYYYLINIKGFSVTQTTVLLGLQELMLIFLEIPTGVVADKISRKFSVGVGIAITSLPLALLPFVDSYLGALIIFSTRAIGKALVSGADSSLLYDTLKDLERVKEYKKIKTQSAALVMGVATICMFIGGWMGQVGLYNLAIILPFPLQLFAAFMVMRMVEPESSRTAKQIQESNYLRHITEAVKVVLKTRTILFFAIAFAVLEGTAVNMKWYYPAIFEMLSFDLWLTGVIMSMLYGVKTLINYLGTRLITEDSLDNTKIWTGAIAGAWIIAAIFNFAGTVVPLLILILLGLELATNSSEELIHEQLESKVRATAMSFVNLLSSVAATVLLWTWGGVIQYSNIKVAIGIQGLFFAVVVGLLMLARGRAISKE